MPSGWENAPEYGGQSGWVWNIGAAVVGAVLILGVVTCSTTAHSQPREIAGVASVVDGDTIDIHGTRIRLSGFDSPEHGSMCGNVNVYQRASLALSDFIGSRTVHCAPSGRDSHGRTVATCTVGGVDLGVQQVTQGWARDWPRYSHGAYAGAERTARANHRGIWGLQCPADMWGNRNYSP